MKRKERLAFLRRALWPEQLESRSMLSGLVGDSAWQNPLDANDINCDGDVSPSDALTAINAINSGTPDDLLATSAPPQLHGEYEGADSSFLDADGDGHLSPSDALGVINAVNAHHDEIVNILVGEDQPEALGADAPEIDLSHGFRSVRGVIANADDVDVFQIAPAKTQLHVALFGRGDGTFSIAVINAAGETLGSAEIVAGSHHPAKVKLEVETSQTYYLEVKGSGGPYALAVLNFDEHVFTPVTDSPLGTDIHGGTSQTATSLTIDDHHTRVVSNIDAEEDADAFSVTAKAGKLVVEAHAEFSLNIDISGDQGSIGTFTTSQRHSIVLNVAAGNYVVTVTAANGSDTGAYGLNIINISLPLGDHEPPTGGDDHPFGQRLFTKVDADGNGSVSLVEFEDAVPGRLNRIADHVFANWDKDESGTLSIDEFVAGLSKLPSIIHHQPGEDPPAAPLRSDG